MGYFTRYDCEIKYLRFKTPGFSNPAPMERNEIMFFENAELNMYPPKKNRKTILNVQVFSVFA